MLPAAVEEDRKRRIEAAIVRVMKSRKQLEHNSLIAEVAKQLSTRFFSFISFVPPMSHTLSLHFCFRFAAGPAFVKKRIESLIEREYLERDKQNRRMYHYLA